MSDSSPSPTVPATVSTEAAILPKIIRFRDLSRCGDEIWIEHEGKLYRLRQTR